MLAQVLSHKECHALQLIEFCLAHLKSILEFHKYWLLVLCFSFCRLIIYKILLDFLLHFILLMIQFV